MRNAARVREVQLLPRAVQDLVRRGLAELRQRGRRRQCGHDQNDRVGGRGDPDRLLREHAGTQRLQGCERGALGLRLERGGDPPADAAQPQVVPHFEEGAGQLLAGIHGDELVGEARVAPRLVVAVVILARVARDRDAHVAQVGGHLRQAAARVFGDGPGRQGFLGGVEVSAHDPRGCDADAEERLDEFRALGPLVVIAHDPPRARAERAAQEDGDEGDGQRHGGAQHAQDEDDPQAGPAPLNGLHRLGLTRGGEQGAQGDDDQVDRNRDTGLGALGGQCAVHAQRRGQVGGQQARQQDDDPAADCGHEARDQDLDDRLEASAQRERDDHEDRRSQNDEALGDTHRQDEDLADQLEAEDVHGDAARGGAGERADRPDEENRDEGDDDVNGVLAAASHARDAVGDVDGAGQAHAAHRQVRRDLAGGWGGGLLRLLGRARGGGCVFLGAVRILGVGGVGGVRGHGRGRGRGGLIRVGGAIGIGGGGRGRRRDAAVGDHRRGRGTLVRIRVAGRNAGGHGDRSGGRVRHDDGRHDLRACLRCGHLGGWRWRGLSPCLVDHSHEGVDPVLCGIVR